MSEPSEGYMKQNDSLGRYHTIRAICTNSNHVIKVETNLAKVKYPCLNPDILNQPLMQVHLTV